MREEIIKKALIHLLENEKERQNWIHKTFFKEKCIFCIELEDLLKELKKELGGNGK